MMRGIKLHPVVAVFLSGIVGCASQTKIAPTDIAKIDLSPHDEIYDRTQTRFAHAVLYIPRGDGIDERFVDLAPLILRAVDDVEVMALGNPVEGGNVHRVNRIAERSVATIYYESYWVTINDQKYERFNYLCSSYPYWTIDENAEFWSQRVSLTLDNDGFPILVELYSARPAGGLFIKYVSSSLETEAREKFGPPLPGRRYSIERPLEEAPRTIVAGVFEDGPVPMGPYIYLSENPTVVTAVRCRCSPSLVDDVVATQGCKMKPIESAMFCGVGADFYRENRSGEKPRPDIVLPRRLRWPRGTE